MFGPPGAARCSDPVSRAMFGPREPRDVDLREPRDNLLSMDSWRRVDVPVLPGSGPAPRLYDTASGELVLAAAGPVATLYACGITPYDATHIGHAATYTAWDLLVRAWLDAMPEVADAALALDAPTPARYTVIYVQNVTDVDDPLLKRAARDGEDWRELARRRTGIEPPERMTDGAAADFVPYESGANPHDAVDRAIAATRKATFPSHGLLAGPW